MPLHINAYYDHLRTRLRVDFGLTHEEADAYVAPLPKPIETHIVRVIQNAQSGALSPEGSG